MNLIKKKNKPDFGGELAIINSAKLESRFSFKTIGSLAINGGWSYIRFNGDENKSIGFNMLNSLKNGQNYLWRITWDTKITKGIEMSLEYEGRKPGNTETIHTGRMSVRAIL